MNMITYISLSEEEIKEINTFCLKTVPYSRFEIIVSVSFFLEIF